MKKWTTKALAILMFTHGVAYVHGHNRGVFSTYENINNQLKAVERLANKRTPPPMTQRVRDAEAAARGGRTED